MVQKKKQTRKLLLKTSSMRWMQLMSPHHPLLLSMYMELKPYQTASSHVYFAFPGEHE